jgi:hypothetical protein
VGSLEWARRTRGRLSARDRAELIAQGVRRQARVLLPRLGSRTAAALDLDAYRPPDTPAARAAEEACREASPRFLEEHCHRVNLWGVAIGRKEGIDFDEEAFYVAALTHDLGLTDSYRGLENQLYAFEVHSGVGASGVVESFQWSRDRSDVLREAILLHVNPRVPPSQGAEAYLLQVAAALDVTGFRFRDIEAVTRASIVTQHPRRRMKDGFKALMDEEVVRHPDSRAAFFTKWLGFKRMIEHAPFDS